MRHPLVLTCLLAGTLPALAQLVLPGAVAPTPEGATVAPNGAGPTGGAANKAAVRRRPRPSAGTGSDPDAAVSAGPAVKVAEIASLGGQTLYLNGRKSFISFELHDKQVDVTHLSLNGEKTSKPQDECIVSIAQTPIPVTERGRPMGVWRIALDLPACPITFDVLDGAVLSTGEPATCEFKAADCSVHANGLWGPQPGTLGPAQVKTTERALTAAEIQVRGNFKRLLALTKDRPTIMGYAREQAAFSSQREEICRDYAGEARHGFCTTRVTEARAAALHAEAEGAAAAKTQRKKERHGKS